MITSLFYSGRLKVKAVSKIKISLSKLQAKLLNAGISAGHQIHAHYSVRLLSQITQLSNARFLEYSEHSAAAGGVYRFVGKVVFKEQASLLLFSLT